MTSTVVMIGLFGSVIVLGFLSQVFLGPDNMIEEASEKLLKDKTGFEADFSPPEKTEKR